MIQEALTIGGKAYAELSEFIEDVIPRGEIAVTNPNVEIQRMSIFAIRSSKTVNF